jgi:hypothetical protein
MKNIKSLANIALLFSVLSIWSSCSKDFLETDLIGANPAENFYLTENDVEMALVSAYDMLHSDHMNDWNSNFLVRQLPSDDSNCGGGGSSDQYPYQQIDDFKWDSRNPRINKLYEQNYFGIYRANRVISHQAPKNANTDLMVAEAKCLRAYFYLDLVICFGGVPIQPEEFVDPTTPLPRASVEEVFAQIEKDLNDVISVLPNKTALGAADRYRMHKQSALGLLMKAHMFQKDYTAAITTFEKLEAFEGTEIGLWQGNFGDLFKKAGEWGSESLIEASFKSTDRAWNGWGTGWGHDGNDFDNRHIQLMGHRFGDMGTSGLRGGWGFLPPTNKIERAFEAGDLRKNHSVLSYEDFNAMYGATANNENGTAHDMEDCIRLKYGAWSSETIDPGTGAAEMEFTTNWRLLRYGDIVLHAAEAYYRNGDEASARTQLNKIRTRAAVGLPASNATGAALLDAIKQERFVELAFEGQRYWDLVRWGDAGSVFSAFQANKHELFPIPELSILNNSGMSPADQNPGY